MSDTSSEKNSNTRERWRTAKGLECGMFSLIPLAVGFWLSSILCEVIRTRPIEYKVNTLTSSAFKSHHGSHPVVVGYHWQQCLGPALHLLYQFGRPRHHDSLLSPLLKCISLLGTFFPLGNGVVCLSMNMIEHFSARDGRPHDKTGQRFIAILSGGKSSPSEV